MNPLSRSAIRELNREHGITLDAVDDLHHILTIAALADAVMKVQRDLRMDAILRPELTIGNVTLRRLSLGAQIWLQEQVSEWFEDTSDDMALSFAFCHARAQDPRDIWKAQGDRKTWTKTVREWARGVGTSEIELLTAVDAFQVRQSELDLILRRIHRRDDPDGAQDKVDDEDQVEREGSFGPIFDILVSQYGSKDDSLTPAEFWAWKVSIDELQLSIDAYLDRQEIELRRGNTSGQAMARDPDSAFARAHHALTEYQAIIVKEKKEHPQGKPAPADYLDDAEPEGAE